jgi:uncharacterized protein YhaN
VKIDKILIRNFGKLRNKDIELKSGINVIYGNNESGKTTIHRFIEAMLFGFHREQAKIRKYNLEYDLYKPKKYLDYGGELFISKGRKTYRIDRNFSNRETLVFYDYDQKIDLTQTLPFDNVYKVSDLSNWLGISYRNFLNTVYLTQNHPLIEKSYYTQIEKELIRGNDRKMSSAIFNKAINWIDNECSKIGSEGRKKTSEYGKTVHKLEQLESEKKDILELEEQLSVLIESGENYRKQKKNLEKQLEEELDIRRKIELKKKYEKYKKFRIKKNDFESLQKELEYYFPYKSFSEREYASLQELEMQLSGIKNQVNEIRKEDKKYFEELNYILKEMKTKKLLAMLIGILTVTGAGVFSWIKNFSSFSILIGLVIFMSGILVGYLGLFKTKQNQKYKMSRINEIKVKLSDVVEIQSKIEKKLKSFCNEVGCTNSKEYRNGLEKKQTYYQLFNQKCEDEVLISRWSDELSNFNYNEKEAIVLDLFDEECDLLDIDILKKALDEVKRELDYTEGLLKGSYEGKRSLVDIQTDIDYYEKRRKLLNFEIKAHKNASALLEKLRESENQLESEDYQKLYNELIFSLTEGKYETLFINDSGDIELKESNSERVWNINELSAGTRAQIFLAIRLSLRSIMTYKETYPMIIDEAFVKYDDNRLKSTFKELNRNDDDQIIVFTCSKRERQILEELELDYNWINIE